MENNSPNPSGVNDSASGEAENTQKDKDQVAYSTYQKVLAEKKRAAEEREKLAQELSEFKKREKDRVEAELKQKEDYKTLLSLREEEAKKAMEELNGIKTQMVEARKFQSILSEINGEIPEQYWGLIDTNKIVVDPNTGLPDKVSIQNYAREFEKTFSAVISPKGKVNIPPQHAATGQEKPISYEEWLKLPAKEMKSKMHLVMKG